MTAIKAVAMVEPLVDNVDPEQIVTNPSLLLSIDINTMKKEDACYR